ARRNRRIGGCARWTGYKPVPPGRNAQMAAIVEARDLVLRFGARRALDGLTLTVNEGETYGLIGPNGAGKTTLIRAIAGLIAPTEGELVVCGARMPSRKVAPQIGYMTQLEAL